MNKIIRHQQKLITTFIAIKKILESWSQKTLHKIYIKYT